MSRDILDITVHLSDGQVLTDKGRNVPATLERMYNQVVAPKSKRFVTIVEPVGRGYLKKGQLRYEGTFHVRFAERGGVAEAQEGTMTCATRQVKKPA